MNSEPAERDNQTSRGRPALKFWHGILFFIPSVVCIGLTFGLAALERARDEASGFTRLSDYGRAHLTFHTGIGGLMAGAVACVVCGLVIGLTSRPGHRLLSCLGCTVVCALVNLLISYAGCAAFVD
jgi:hypothetical protein